MRVIDLPHVLGAIEGMERRGLVLRIITDLPLSSKARGHNREKLQALQKAVERIAATEPYLKYDYLELTNESLSRRPRAR
jgi:hypothetical protein